MWQATHEQIVPGLDRAAVWQAWADVDRWHVWDHDIEYAKLETDFGSGGRFVLKPKGGPRITIQLLRAEHLVGYTDLTTFPFARMYGIHDMADGPDGVRLTITIRVEGPLAWLWRKLVAQKIADEAPIQLQSLADYVRRGTLTHAGA